MSMLLEIEKEVFKNFPYGVASMQEIIPLVQDIMGEHWTNNSKHSEGAITTAISRACETSDRNSIIYEDTFYKIDKGIYGLIQYKEEFNKAIDREEIINKALERRIEIIENVKAKKEEIINKAKISEKEILEDVSAEGKKKRVNKRLEKGQVKLDDRGRNITLVNNLKKLHLNICQICGDRIEDEFGTTSEAHHIKHFSKNGDDTIDNMIILCPNCHTKIHRFSIPLEKLRIVQKYSTHYISDKNLEWYEKQRELKISNFTEKNK